MNKFYIIFDYFKKAFEINKENKILYTPQLVLIATNSLLMLGTGYFLYDWIVKNEFLESFIYSGVDVRELLPRFFGMAFFFVILALLLIIVSIVVEAGLYNMYKMSITTNRTEINHFWEGVSKYFIKFLGADALLLLFWIVMFLPFMLISIITFTIGFTLVPIIVATFLTMWKVSIVMNDSTITKGLDDSIKFAKNNFAPLLALQIIHWSFSKTTGRNSLGQVSDIFNERQSPAVDNMFQNRQDIIEVILKYIKIGFAIIIPVITIAYAFSAIVTMIIEVFFALTLFIAYNEKFEQSLTSNVEVAE